MNGLPLIFFDGFDDGTHRWTCTDPDAWRLAEEEDGNRVFELHTSSDYEPPVRSPLSIARIQNLSVTDFILQARMKQTGREYGHRDLCLFYGYQDPSHFYYTHIATQADPNANSIFLVNAEPRISIAAERTDGTDWSEGWHDVRIVRDATVGSIEVFFDDMETPIMTATDTTFTWGGIGLGSFDDVGMIDDVRVWGVVREEAR